MDWLRQFRFFVLNWFRRGRLEAEMAEEMRSHLEMEAAARRAAGMPAADAKWAAARSFGGIEQIKEQAREARGWFWLENFFQDLRFGVRMMKRQPGFTAIILLSLAIGIGANIVVFSAANAFVFRPLPMIFRPDRIVYRHPWGGSCVSYPEFEYVRDHNTLLSAIAASAPCQGDVTLVDPATDHDRSQDRTEYVAGARLVSANYFSLLGTPVQLGRSFRPDEDRFPGTNPVVILSDRYWRAHFNADPTMVGRVLILNGTAFTVIGVGQEGAPLEPGLLEEPSFWVPMMMQGVIEPGRDRLRSKAEGAATVYFFGRMKEGVLLRQVRSEMAVLDAQYVAQNHIPTEHRPLWAPVLETGYSLFWWRPQVVTVIVGLLGMASVILVVACANVGSLLLARATTRQREISIRLAIGAGRGRIFRQLLAEGMLIAGLGGGLGLLLGAWAGWALWPAVFRLGGDAMGPVVARLFGFDGRVAAYGAAMSLFAGVFAALTPALEARRAAIQASLTQQGSLLGRRVSNRQMRHGLVVLQVAGAVTCLFVAALAVRMVWRSSVLVFPFELRHVFWVESTALPGAKDIRSEEFSRALVEKMRAIGGVQGAARADIWHAQEIPEEAVAVDGRAVRTGRVELNRVDPDYFGVIGLHAIRGRTFLEEETRTGRPVFVVSVNFAQRFWPGQDPVGHRLKLDVDEGEGEVIGVVHDGVRDISLEHDTRSGDVYAPIKPASGRLPEIWVRTNVDPGTVMKTMREIGRNLNANVVVKARGPLSEAFKAWTNMMVGIGCAVGILGGLALFLAAIGVNGIMAFAVAQRRREIGIRLALGASQTAARNLILGEGIRLVGRGLVLGGIIAVEVASLLRSLLFGLSPADPLSLATVGMLLGGVALLACWLPARSAAKVDPMVALRSE